MRATLRTHRAPHPCATSAQAPSAHVRRTGCTCSSAARASARLGAASARAQHGRGAPARVDSVNVECANVASTKSARVHHRWLTHLLIACAVIFFIAPNESPAQSPPPGVVERDTIVPGPIPLPATITLPAGKGPFPGVVLVHNGTADGDRDETIGEIRPFRDIAWGLAERGIVVLRYEKRSRTEPSWFARAGFTVFDETVQDAVAAARLLRSQVELNPKKIFVAGHGLGGIVAPRIARIEGELAGIIIMNGATQVRLADQMEQQLQYKITMAGADSFKVRYQLQPIRPSIDRIRALTEKDSFDIQPMRGLGGTSPKYWLDMNSPDPATVVRGLKLPILVLQGMRDFEMPASNLDGWVKAVGPRKNLVIKQYPTLSHTLTESTGVPSTADYAKPQTVSTQVLVDMAEWIKQN